MNKKIFSLLAVGAITTSIFSGVIANAATPGDKDVQVTYNNQNVITDPDNPGAPQWQVAIPSGINFTEDKKTADVSVELQKMDGNPYTDAGLNVAVKIKSKNSYALKKNNSNSTLDYTVSYGDKTMVKNDQVQDIGTLNDSENKKSGLAKLSDGVATELGNHTDTLTYTVEKQ